MNNWEKVFSRVMTVLTLFVLVFFLVGGTTHRIAYAAPNAGTENAKDMNNIVAGLNLVNGTTKDEVNVTSTSKWINIIIQLIGYLMGGPSVLISDEATLSYIESQPEVQEFGTYGLAGKVDGGLRVAFNNYPLGVTPNSYLAKEWSPKSTQAAAGQSALEPIYDIWKYVRNIAYLGFVVVTIGIGFMIMFRQKVGGQVAVSITNAIPRVIVGMALVHLSFFLAGLIFSLGTYVMALIETVLNTYYTGGMQAFDLGAPWDMWKNVRIIVRSADPVESSFMGILNSSRQAFNFGGFQALPSIGKALGQYFKQGLVSIVIKIVFWFGLLFASFKIFFNLIKAYAMMFIQTIALPIVTLFGSLPGKQKVIMEAYKGLLINSMIFPATYAMLNLAVLISTTTGGIQFPTVADPNAAGVDPRNNLIGSGPGTNLAGFIGYGMVLAATQVETVLKEAFQKAESKSTQAATAGIKKQTSKIPLLGKVVSGGFE